MTKSGDPISAEAREERVASAFRSSMSWNVANMGVSQVITMSVFVFLTYRLDPVIFGVFALGVIFIDYFNYQGTSSGVDSVIQSQDFSKRALSSAFWSMMFIYAIVAACLFASGGLLASVMGEQKLALVLPVLALTLLPLPFSIAPSATLMRDHDFKGIAIRGILGSVLGGLAALATAFSAFPEWALVAQRGVSVLSSALFLMIRAKWFPTLEFSKSLAASFLANASRIFFAQGIASSYMRILDVIVGISFGAAAVGLMRIASRFVEAMYGTFASPIGSLWVILLSEKDQSADSRANLLSRLTQMSSLICLPVFAGVGLISSDLVEFALDDDYVASAPMLAMFCAAGLMVPFSYFRNHALTALRKLNLLLGLSILDVIVVALAGLAMSRYSATAVVAAILIMHVVRGIVTAPILISALGARWRKFLEALLPAYIAIVVMALAIFGVSLLVSDAAVGVRLITKISVGAIVYVGYLLVFHKAWSITALEMLRRNKTPVAA